MTLPTALKDELSECLLLLTEQAPACLAEILATRKALGAGSPVLHLRFSRLLENALERGAFSEDDARRLGVLAHALNQAAGGEFADDPNDRQATVIFRCPAALKARLQEFCAAGGMDVSTACRAAVSKLLEDTP
jgi:hypothetical protein